MNFIYNDVEGEILSFLINSRSMLDVFLINKRWNNLLKSSRGVLEYFFIIKRKSTNVKRR